jgi:hypothetical protein
MAEVFHAKNYRKVALERAHKERNFIALPEVYPEL